jgi:hypothetical protein
VVGIRSNLIFAKILGRELFKVFSPLFPLLAVIKHLTAIFSHARLLHDPVIHENGGLKAQRQCDGITGTCIHGKGTVLDGEMDFSVKGIVL